MAWEGYFSVGGAEVINVARTEAYAEWANLGWFKATYNIPELAYALGDAPYVNPFVDDAPWYDPDAPESAEFYGFYPIDVSGIEDSTGSSTVTEFISVGGNVGRTRHATKPVTFAGLIIAGSEEGADYGMRWLKTALLGGPCSDNSQDTTTGSELCYLSAEPSIYVSTDDNAIFAVLEGSELGDVIVDGQGGDEEGSLTLDGQGPAQLLTESIGPFVVTPTSPGAGAEECLVPLLRSLHKFKVTRNPVVQAKKQMVDGGRVWSVAFTGTAGMPWEFGYRTDIIEGFMDPAVANPFAPGVTGTYDLNGLIVDDAACVTEVWEPLFDPLCPALIPPPAPPDIPLGCYVPPVNWRRRQITIPAKYVPLWDSVVPTVEVHARDEDLRNLRLRFYADVDGTGDPNVDGCAYCGDIVISYVPQNTTLVFDGVTETIWVQYPGGGRRRADNVVFRTDGKPFDWPSLTCGFGYIVTFDLPQTQAAPVVDLSLTARSA